MNGKACGIRRAVLAFILGLGLMVLAGCATAAPSSSGNTPASGSSAASSGASSASSAASSASAPSGGSQVEGVLPESAWGNLFATVGESAVAFGQRVQADLPVKAYACWQGEGGGEPIWYEDPADVKALFNALASSGVAGEAQSVSTDDYTSFGFEFANGDTYGFMFDSMALEVQEGGTWKAYELDASPALAAYAQNAKDHTMSQYR